MKDLGTINTASPREQRSDLPSEQVKKLAEKFEFLDKLRDSGKTNMFGAPSFLVKKFKINRDASQRITSQWMKEFDGKASAEDRARAAIAKATGAA